MIYKFFTIVITLLSFLLVGQSFRLQHSKANSCFKLMNHKNAFEVTSEPMSAQDATRNNFKNFMGPLAVGAAAALFSFGKVAFADEATTTAVIPQVTTMPNDFGLQHKDYYADCQQVVNHMRIATSMEKGNPILVEFAQKTKDEMLDFVSYYRRFQGISGKQSFSLLYTSINVLSGHYTSYGVKVPVPEKRRKRLLQEFNDIEKNIRRKR